MSDNIIVDTATRIFGDLCEPQTINAAEEGNWPAELWDALEESGLTLTWVPDTLGGAGVCFTPKDLEYAAELLGELAYNDGFRAGVIAGQRRRLQDFGEARLTLDITSLLSTVH